ncbi:MAG TPA: CTP synthase [Candidatus Pacebacteria bacterium]|nr:CTP synthase [Candidatus Paceibacterota bacterium]
MAKKKNKKYIFVVGGVMSGVGKGITTSSIANIIQSRGFSVTALKVDPYINVDAGTMNPTEHGEVFVLADGDETDQDMGNYERFLETELPSSNYMTTGRVYQTVIERERRGGYKGKCVEVVPHIPLEVISRLEKAAKKENAEVVITEIGGTIGEYQSLLFLEAARMLKTKHSDDVLFVLVSYVPLPSKVGEMKTKPTQYASRTLNGAGIQADIIIARSEVPMDDKRKEKIAMSCAVDKNSVISAPDVDSIYHVPLNFEKDNLSNIILKKLGLKARKRDISKWENFTKKIDKADKTIKIGIVGKYFETGDFVLSDAYISVIEALKHASYHNGYKPELAWLDSSVYENDISKLKDLKEYDGIVVPGGFGSRGIEGKISVAKYCRENKIPYFGLCYGMQIAVIEFARNVAGIQGAQTAEIDDKSKNLVIDILPEQKEKLKKKDFGGSMRLGSYPAKIIMGTIARNAYKKAEITERHRHRYEVNPEYIQQIEKAGLVFSGKSPDGILMEIVELPKEIHPFYLATQFHPEFQSTPLTPHPLFMAFVKEVQK